uniref:DNA polymerase delta small subunit n=1 Tax=Parastrongyloides trichosuri TaxID=131310 RepID=A0A0N4Z0P5_PARTI
MPSVKVASGFKSMNQDFIITEDLWSIRENEGVEYQLNCIYKLREDALRDRVLISARKKLGDDINISDFNKLAFEENGLLCGILQLKMIKRKSIISNLEIEEDNLVIEENNDYMENIEKSEKDVLNLVTKDLVVQLKGIDKYEYCHGIVVGIYGCKHKGEQMFQVKHVFFPEPAPQRPRTPAVKETYICFISDLKFSDNTPFEKKNYLNFLTTCFFKDNEYLPDPVKKIFFNTERIIITGGNFDDSEFYKRSYNILDLKEPLISHEQLTDADSYFSCLSKLVPVHLMSGICDLGSGSWPIQPPYRKVFTKSCKLEEDFLLTTNPTLFEVNGVTYLGTSGDNITDILRTKENSSSLDAMEQILTYQHLSPTAPDHMSIYVNNVVDQMVLNTTPHVFFCGGQKEFGRKTVNIGDYKVLLLSIPSFCETNTITFINTKTLECFPYTLNLCV